MLSTSAVAVPIFPAASIKANSNTPFSVNVYVLLPSLLVIVASSSIVNVATTSLFVASKLS